MSEELQELQELWDKFRSLVRDKSWGKLIRISNQLIKRKLDIEKTAEVYYELGNAYFMRDENELAIENLTEAIKIKPKYALAYSCRGHVYSEQGNYDEALTDFKEAIKIKPNDVNNYSGRGITYSKKGDHNNALIDFNKALELQPKSSMFYTIRGIAYLRKGNYDLTIQDLTEAIKLDSENARAFHVRGMAYFVKKNYNKSFADFMAASKCDSMLKFRYPQLYLVFTIDNMYKIDIEKKMQVFALCTNLLNVLQSISEGYYRAPEKSEYVHYTSLYTLKKLVRKNCFRLYNADYMNDPEEGQVFLKMIPENIVDVKSVFYGGGIGSSSLSPAYIGSFIVPDSAPRKDSLSLWRTYGNHGAEEAAGSCMIFKQKHFDTNPPNLFGFMKQPRGKKKNVKPSLYKVIYVDQTKTPRIFYQLAKALGLIEKYMNANKNSAQNIALKKLVRELLDTIRFLFKADYYKDEREVRIIDFNYDYRTSKEDTESIPPRFYVNTSKKFRFSEVILGPRAKHFRGWKQWIKKHDKNIKVKKTDIKYGRQDS